MKRKVLVSVTTISGEAWIDKIEEIKELGLKEIALFVTCLGHSDRKACYSLLGTVPDLRIPFVHARSDMHPDEFYYLMNTFGTEIFNLHSERDFPYAHDISELKSKICIENSGLIEENDFIGFRGLCIDLSHLEDDRYNIPKNYHVVNELMRSHKVYANHISAVRKRGNNNWYSSHVMHDVSDLDYVSKFSPDYFGKYMALELENPIKEQLMAKARLEELLGEALG